MLGVNKLRGDLQDVLAAIQEFPEDTATHLGKSAADAINAAREGLKHTLKDLDDSDRFEAILRDAVRGALETGSEYEVILRIRKRDNTEGPQNNNTS